MKFILLIISLCTSLFLNAQIKKGVILFGGDLQIYSSNTTYTYANKYISKNNDIIF